MTNELTQLIEPSGSCASGTPAASSGCIKFAYDLQGKEVTRTFPGGAVVTTTRDSSERPTEIVAKTGTGTVVFDKTYSYALGSADTADVQTNTSVVETGVPTNAVTTYAYDTLDRLTSATEKTAAGATNASWAYTYDADGNMTQQTLAGNVGTAAGAQAAGTLTETYNAADELTGTSADTSTWSYDGAGEQTQDGLTGKTTAYNDRGGVTSFGTETYATYAAGNSPTYSRADSGTTTSYTNSSQLGLMGEDYGNQCIYDRTPSGDAVGSRLGGGSNYYFVNDALGSVVGIFDKSGGYYGGYTYSPYGTARYTSSNAALSNNHLRYISGYYDTSSGDYLLGARYYNPSVGRFTQQDPSGLEPDGYAYAADNPISNTDINGLISLSTINKALGILKEIWEKVEKHDNIVKAIQAIKKKDLKTLAGLFLNVGVSALCGALVSAVAVAVAVALSGGAALFVVFSCGLAGDLAEQLVFG